MTWPSGSLRIHAAGVSPDRAALGRHVSSWLTFLAKEVLERSEPGEIVAASVRPGAHEMGQTSWDVPVLDDRDRPEGAYPLLDHVDVSVGAQLEHDTSALMLIALVADIVDACRT